MIIENYLIIKKIYNKGFLIYNNKKDIIYILKELKENKEKDFFINLDIYIDYIKEDKINKVKELFLKYEDKLNFKTIKYDIKNNNFYISIFINTEDIKDKIIMNFLNKIEKLTKE